MKIYLKCISKEEWSSRFSVRPEQLVVSLVALCAAKCIGSPVPYSSQMWPPRCWFLSWKPLASSWELLWFKKRIEKCRRGCFGGVWLSCGVGFSVSIYLPYSWCVTCRKFAFLFCLGCNWAVFLISQVKLDTTEFLEKPFFAIVLKPQIERYGMRPNDWWCDMQMSNASLTLKFFFILCYCWPLSSGWKKKKNCETEVKPKMVVVFYLSTAVWALLWGKEALPFLEAAAEGLVKPELFWNHGGGWTARILPRHPSVLLQWTTLLSPLSFLDWITPQHWWAVLKGHIEMITEQLAALLCASSYSKSALTILAIPTPVLFRVGDIWPRTETPSWCFFAAVICFVP